MEDDQSQLVLTRSCGEGGTDGSAHIPCRPEKPYGEHHDCGTEEASCTRELALHYAPRNDAQCIWIHQMTIRMLPWALF